MDDTLRILQYVYEEEVDDPSFVRRVDEDDELRREYERLRETKQVLDRRSPPSPDPAVVDRVVERAADAAREHGANGPMPDRAARSPERGWSRRLQTAGAALTLLLVVGLGWWQLRPDGTTPTSATGEAPTSQAEAAAPGSEQVQEADAVPEWDDREEVVRLHRGIEVLRTRSGSGGWGGDVQTIDRARP